MGCDIHAMIERRVDHTGNGYYADKTWSEWLNAGDPDLKRNYNLFTVLAGVRDGYGVDPIAQPRLIGDRHQFDEDKAYAVDVCDEFNGWAKSWGRDGHSHSYVTLRELKEYGESFSLPAGFEEQAAGEIKSLRDVVQQGEGLLAAPDSSDEEKERVAKVRERYKTWLRSALQLKSAPPIERFVGREWGRLLKTMARLSKDGTGDDVRLVFFFDN